MGACLNPTHPFWATVPDYEAVAQKATVYDLETSLDHKTIWMMGYRGPGEKTAQYVTTAQEAVSLLDRPRIWCGHNILGFDNRVLKEVWGIDLSKDILIDTLVLSRLLNPSRQSHSLAALLPLVGMVKGDFKDYDRGLCPEMVEYGLQDVNGTRALMFYLLQKLADAGFSNESIWLEHQVFPIIAAQERRGFLLDVPKAMALHAKWKDQSDTVRDQLIATFPPTEVVMKTKTKYIPFNPGSRQQCVDRLKALGWVPTRYTDPTPLHPKGQPKFDHITLEEIDALGVPMAKQLALYYKLIKAIPMVKSWLDKADDHSRVHGRVNSNGAVTGRMTHMDPNLGQIPVRDEDIGPACRELFMAADGYVLVGVDAKGLELRIFSHYLQNPEYQLVILTGDVHSKNAELIGKDRSTAKTFIYAYLYGAGGMKIALICGIIGDEEELQRAGNKIKNRFQSNLPGLEALKDKVATFVRRSRSLPGIDGRVIESRSEHSALNALFQGAGAAAMKVALVLCDRGIKEANLDAHFVVNVHDEFQVETLKDHAEAVREIGLRSIVEAGEVLGLRCPLEGDAKIGRNWLETH